MCCDTLVAGHFEHCRFPLQITFLAVPDTHLRSPLFVVLLEFPWTLSLLMCEFAEVSSVQLGLASAYEAGLEGVFQVTLASSEMYLFERNQKTIDQ